MTSEFQSYFFGGLKKRRSPTLPCSSKIDIREDRSVYVSRGQSPSAASSAKASRQLHIDVALAVCSLNGDDALFRASACRGGPVSASPTLSGKGRRTFKNDFVLWDAVC